MVALLCSLGRSKVTERIAKNPERVDLVGCPTYLHVMRMRLGGNPEGARGPSSPLWVRRRPTPSPRG